MASRAEPCTGRRGFICPLPVKPSILKKNPLPWMQAPIAGKGYQGCAPAAHAGFTQLALRNIDTMADKVIPV